MDYLTLFVIAAVTAILLFGFVLISLPYSALGVLIKLKNIVTKKNTGLIALINKSGSIGQIVPVDLRKDSEEIKVGQEKHIYPLQDDHFSGMKMFGLPIAFFHAGDSKTNVGIYYHQCDEEGEPVFLSVSDGKGKSISIPYLSPHANSISLNSSAIGAVIMGKALSEAIGKIFMQYKTQIYILGGIGAGIAICAYFTYQMKTVDLPLVLAKLNEISAVCQAVVE